jgi:hypothetical protein
VAALQANPPGPTNQAPVTVPVTIAGGGFSHEEAAIFKAEVESSIAMEVKKFEAFITANAKGLVRPPPRPHRRRVQPGKLTLAAPAPQSSTPNIIDLATNSVAPPSGLLLDVVLH